MKMAVLILVRVADDDVVDNSDDVDGDVDDDDYDDNANTKNKIN